VVSYHFAIGYPFPICACAVEVARCDVREIPFTQCGKGSQPRLSHEDMDWGGLQNFCTAPVLNRISFQKLANSLRKAILRALLRLRLDILHSNSRIFTDPGFIWIAYHHAARVHYKTMSRWQHPSSTSW
jgi:hypothetical protein